MKLHKVSFYQAVELPMGHTGKTNVHTLSSEIVPGISLELCDHVVIVSHDEWDQDILVATSNVRYATTKKVLKTFNKDLEVPAQVNKKKLRQ